MPIARSVLPDEEVLDALASGLRARLAVLLILALTWLSAMVPGARRRVRDRVARLERSVWGLVLLRTCATIAHCRKKRAPAARDVFDRRASAFRRLTRAAFVRGGGLVDRVRRLLALLDDPSGAIAALAARLAEGFRACAARPLAARDVALAGAIGCSCVRDDTS